MVGLFTFFFFILLTSTEARKVERHCRGAYIHETIKHGSERQIQTLIGEPASRITIHCMSALVEYTSDSQAQKDVCKGEDIENNHSVYLRAKQLNDSTILNQWELKYVVGGSLEKATYNIANQGTYSLFFENRHPQNCDMQVTLSVEYNLVNESIMERSEPDPALVNVQPRTIFVGTEAILTFQIDRLETNTENDHAIAIPLTSNCIDTLESDRRVFERLESSTKTNTVWKHRFSETGPYRVCYQRGNFPFEEAGRIVIYSSNPLYFIIGHVGKLALNQKQKFFFIGSNLSTTADEVKVVRDETSCREGESAAKAEKDPEGVSIYAPGTAASFSVTFKAPGRYRICYKHAGTLNGSWAEVPDFDDMPEDVPRPILTMTANNISSPKKSPTDSPVQSYLSRPNCVLPYMLPNKSFENLSLCFTTNRLSLHPHFLDTLAEILCIPKETIVITDISQVASSELEIIWFIDCLDYDVQVCDRSERMTYAYIAFDKNINNVATNMKILQVVGREVSSLAIGDDAKHIETVLTTPVGYSSVTTGLCLLAIFILLAILGFFAYLSYMGRNGYASPLQAIRNVMSHDEEDGVSMSTTVGTKV